MKKCFNNIINDDPFVDFDEKEKELETLMVLFADYVLENLYKNPTYIPSQVLRKQLEDFLSQSKLVNNV